ncbi:hypothetical protein GE21DRAFT_281 [Neurospora crassa]|uniref:Uncharacterized protein n=1 Tax=Neurospora crassa (strain ATCC 24698 / 74-OR23-1A / CBS 708.71 / DSM 1257 / FGSC 987) TaxID=367110 RepID=Q7SES1_NEUCR|nr:hypothetical protein NCU02145 [Neurospora crassa OR74A]EAA35268.1 hypothetical protein NCU02145 [Neurospora crassa OR74A]KHE83949.1 hypothetical protein GE21DRAFT_281 [Neurospora crassa]|eukprot:XP_964504.1 hypothetical protein NCU02145 [Neurospora crassa OR74A]
MLGRYRECGSRGDYPRLRQCPSPNSVSNSPVVITASTREFARPREEATAQIPMRGSIPESGLEVINIEKRWFESGAHLKQGAFETTPLEICRSCLTIMCAFDMRV